MSDGVLPRARLEELYREILGDESEEDPARWQKRMRILRAATELFIRHGYRKTSVDEIARRAEVAKGTVYLYFPNKSAILVQAVALEKRAYLDLLAPILDGTMPAKKRLAFFLRTVLEVTHQLPLVARLLRDDADLKAALEEIDPALYAQNQAVGIEWIAEMIEQAAPGRFDAEERAARAELLIEARYFTSLLSEERPRIGTRSVKDLARTLADVMLYGLVHRPDAEEP